MPSPTLPLRIYADTSVIGGCLDEEFAYDSNRLFDLARSGRLHILISNIVIDELRDAPPKVQQVLATLPETAVRQVRITDQVIALREAYLAAGIVGPRWIDDLTHVAAATLARADAIVSWNFKHIVRLELIGRYNQVNRKLGHPDLAIITPLEVTREIDA